MGDSLFVRDQQNIQERMKRDDDAIWVLCLKWIMVFGLLEGQEEVVV